MAITHVNTTTGTPTSAVTSTSTVTKPSGLAVNDVMVAYVVANKAGITQPGGSGNTRWHRIITQDASSNQWRVEVWYCVATSSEVAASNFVWNDGDNQSPMWVAISAYRGVDPVNPIEASAITSPSSSSSPQTSPTVTTANRAMILAHRAVRCSSGTTTFTSAGFQERIDGHNGAAVSYCAAMYERGESDPGSISGISITAQTTSNITDTVATTVALRSLIVAVNASAGVAGASVSAKDPILELTASPGVGTAQVSAHLESPVGGVGATAGVASAATVSVKIVDVFTTPFKNAPAGSAQVSVSTKQTGMDYASAGIGHATVVVTGALTSISDRADTAQAVGAAYGPSLGFQITAGVAQASGAGVLAAPGLGSPADVARALASAYPFILYYGSTRTIAVGQEDRLLEVAAENRTLMVEES